MCGPQIHSSYVAALRITDLFQASNALQAQQPNHLADGLTPK